MGNACEGCPDNCEDKLCSKFYMLVCLMLTVDSGVMSPLNQTSNNSVLSCNFYLNHLTGKINII